MDNIRVFLDKLIENSEYDKPLWNVEHLLENSNPKWNYIDGCMVKAIMEVYYATNDKKYLDFVTNFIDFYVDEDGNILGYNEEDYNCDNINEGKVLFMLYDIHGKEKYKNALDKLYHQLENQPRTQSGNFWHKLIYPNQIWLDGLYMVQPFYTEYEMKFNGAKNYKDVYSQFKNVVELMKDKETGLYYHGYDETREQDWSDNVTGLSKNFWTRSIGWFSMALVDTIEKMSDMFFFEREQLIGYLKDLAESVIKYMDSETSLFYQVTDKGNQEGNYLETSGTCAIAYSLMKGARLGYLPTYYHEIGNKIYNSIVENKLELTDEVFNLKDICLVAGLGGMPGKGSYKNRDGTFEYYISEPIVNNDAKGVAPFLFAYSEVLRNGGAKNE